MILYTSRWTQNINVSAQKPCFFCAERESQVLFLTSLTTLFDATKIVFIFSDAEYSLNIGK